MRGGGLRGRGEGVFPSDFAHSIKGGNVTVKELRKMLSGYSPDTPVLVDRHSEYAEATEVQEIQAFDNGGYYSKTYHPVDTAKAKRCVRIS